MATKRVRKRLVAQVRLADGSDGERVFRSLADAKTWVTDRGAVLVDHRWREVTVWRGRVTDLNGDRREQTFETKAAAVAWEKEMGAALEQGFDPDLGKRSLRSWHAEWLKGRPAEALAASEEWASRSGR